MKKDEKYLGICRALKALAEALEDFTSHAYNDSYAGSCDESSDRESAKRRNCLEECLAEVSAHDGMPRINICFDDVVSSRDVWFENWVPTYYHEDDVAYKLWEDNDYTGFLDEDHDRSYEEYKKVAKAAADYLNSCVQLGYDYEGDEDDE